MKIMNAILVFGLCISMQIKAQSTSSISDSIIRQFEKEIGSRTFDFTIASDYEDHQYLRIVEPRCKDSCTRLVHDIYFRGGDCNATRIITSVFECKDSNIIFYTRNEWIEHFDDTKPHPLSSYTIETYKMNVLGEINLFESIKGKEHSKIAKLVQLKIE